MVLFETERLIARRLTKDDVPAMFAIYGDVVAMRYVGDGDPLDEEGCSRWVDLTDQNFERRGYAMVALEEKSSGTVIGCAGIVHPDQQPEPEVKYAFRQDRWGKGYATEAITALVQWGRDAHQIKELIATTAPGNKPSHNVLSKVGFRQTETRDNDDGSQTQVWIITAD